MLKARIEKGKHLCLFFLMSTVYNGLKVKKETRKITYSFSALHRLERV